MHIFRNILYLCFAIREGVVKCAAVYETTNRIHEIHTSLHCLFYICVFVCCTRERKFAGQTGWTRPLETCASACVPSQVDASWGHLLPRTWEKYTLVVLSFIIDVVAFERVQCKKKFKKKSNQSRRKIRERVSRLIIHIFYKVWMADTLSWEWREKKKHTKNLFVIPPMFLMCALLNENCVSCVRMYVRACAWWPRQKKLSASLYIYIYDEKSAFVLPFFVWATL